LTSDPSHTCETWTIRRAPDGHRYCAACGRDITPAPAAIMEEDPAGWVAEALQITLHPWQTRIIEGLLAPPTRAAVVGLPHASCGNQVPHWQHNFYRPASGWMTCRGEI
jgi:hypothetical protein